MSDRSARIMRLVLLAVVLSWALGCLMRIAQDLDEISRVAGQLVPHPAPSLLR